MSKFEYSDPIKIQSKNTLYDEKIFEYYNHVRFEIIDLIPKNTKQLLDVGCGNGETSLAAKNKLNIQKIVGIEMFEPAAVAAGSKMDQVITGDIESLDLNFPENYFDCILCLDLLEHTKDPWNVLLKLHRILDNDGVLIVSIPNIAHLIPIIKIIFDRFEYEDAGILDKTHLRFFTLNTILKMLFQTGYIIQQIETNRSKGWKWRLLNIFSVGLFRKLSIYQYIIVASKYHCHSLKKMLV